MVKSYRLRISKMRSKEKSRSVIRKCTASSDFSGVFIMMTSSDMIFTELGEHFPRDEHLLRAVFRSRRTRTKRGGVTGALGTAEVSTTHLLPWIPHLSFRTARRASSSWISVRVSGSMSCSIRPFVSGVLGRRVALAFGTQGDVV